MKSQNNTVDFTGNTIQGFIPNNIPVVSVTEDYQALTTNTTIICSGGSFTVTLFTSVGNDGKTLKINNQNNSSMVMVDGFGSQTINGQLVQYVPPKSCLELQFDGANVIIN